MDYKNMSTPDGIQAGIAFQRIGQCREISKHQK